MKYKRPKLKRGEEYCLKVTKPAISAGNGTRGFPRTVIFKKVYLFDVRSNGRAVVVEDVMRWKATTPGIQIALADPKKVAEKRTINYEVNQAHLIAPWSEWETGPKEVRKGVLEMAGS